MDYCKSSERGNYTVGRLIDGEGSPRELQEVLWW